ncbi:MAG: hypothetical protein U1E65_22795 [Myxococcota bacterium]
MRALSLFLAAFWGCGQVEDAPLLDAGQAAMDASPSAPDAAETPDAGVETPDASETLDASAEPPDASPAAPDASETTDAGAPPDRLLAAARTAETNPLCTAIAPFYWEIGDQSGPLASGRIGTAYSATTAMAIASASKWVFGAYVVERFKADVGQIDHRAMTMLSGYTSFTGCGTATTVAECQSAGRNGRFTPADVDHFSYGGGHFQKYAVDLGLGAETNRGLTAAYDAMLGSDFAFSFWTPQLAGGMSSTPAGYARFLRKILAGGLAIHDHLGEDAVCTLPGPSCPTAIGSPGDEDMHYSYGHWVEDEPGLGDGSFSSAGAFGFYPWINASKSLYGVLARRATTGGSGMDSLRCGRLIRKAFVTGVTQ